jgi:hypothetical protein
MSTLVNGKLTERAVQTKEVILGHGLSTWTFRLVGLYRLLGNEPIAVAFQLCAP